MGALRVNGNDFALPEALAGRQFVVTALKRGPEFVDLEIRGARFDFDHPEMRLLLKKLEATEPGSPIAPLAEDTLRKIEKAIRE